IKKTLTHSASHKLSQCFVGGAVKKGFEKKDERAKLATGEVFSVKGGLSNLINALVARIGNENILLNTADLTALPVRQGLNKFNRLDNGDNYKIKLKQDGEELEISSKYLITTSGSHELPGILPFLDATEAHKLNNLLYAKVLQASIGFDKWEGIPLDAFGGLVPFKENRDVLGILFLSSFLTGRAPEGGALLSVFMGGVRKPHLAELPDQDVIKILDREVRAMTGLKEFFPSLLKITRYTHAIPQYGLSTGERLEMVEHLQKKYPGLVIGGNLCGGIGMSDRIKQGREMSEMIY
ncbi:MAG TPA: FAD-dependent oxidoreductase, partial [Bacteroidales bacterium]|nr:FAD-dependent oxidoreductase [Bacteroidales bacterium]